MSQRFGKSKFGKTSARLSKTDWRRRDRWEKTLLTGFFSRKRSDLKKWWKVMGDPKGRDRNPPGNEVAVKLFKSAGDRLTLNGKTARISGILDETGSQDDFSSLGFGFCTGSIEETRGLEFD